MNSNAEAYLSRARKEMSAAEAAFAKVDAGEGMTHIELGRALVHLRTAAHQTMQAMASEASSQDLAVD